jgi:hypothetical protein
MEYLERRTDIPISWDDRTEPDDRLLQRLLARAEALKGPWVFEITLQSLTDKDWRTTVAVEADHLPAALEIAKLMHPETYCAAWQRLEDER